MKLTSRTNTLLALVLTALTACGGGSVDPATATKEGQKALASGDSALAAKNFNEALLAIGGDTKNPSFTQAKLGLVKALVGVEPARAVSEVEALVASHPDLMDDKALYDIADRLRKAGKYSESTALLKLGTDKFPDSKALDTLGKALADDQANMPPEVLAELAGLGYL